MSMNLRWVGEEDYDRVAETRMRCYAPAAKEIDRFKEGMRADPRQKPGDFLLAEEGGEAVGTATALSFTMRVRGGAVPCQGVAYVGTVRTRRRAAGGRAGAEPGVASALMRETLRKARERGEVLSALMPFRASFYERFGYGVVERRCEWVVPLAVLPQGECGGIRYARPDDRPGVRALHQRAVERGQCDIERSAGRWDAIDAKAGEGFEIVDPADHTPAAAGGAVRGHLFYTQYVEDRRDVIRVQSQLAEDRRAFLRQLYFFATLKDQYHALSLALPADVPLNWLLCERQLPHRLVNHPVAELRPQTRMQVRVLDHRRVIEAMRLPDDGPRGAVTVCVRESDGHVSKFRVALDGGRASVADSAAGADVECPDAAWAAVVLGDLPAAQAAALGLIDVKEESALRVLGEFGRGPVPFSQEYF